MYVSGSDISHKPESERANSFSLIRVPDENNKQVMFHPSRLQLYTSRYIRPKQISDGSKRHSREGKTYITVASESHYKIINKD